MAASAVQGRRPLTGRLGHRHGGQGRLRRARSSVAMFPEPWGWSGHDPLIEQAFDVPVADAPVDRPGAPASHTSATPMSPCPPRCSLPPRIAGSGGCRGLLRGEGARSGSRRCGGRRSGHVVAGAGRPAPRRPRSLRGARSRPRTRSCSTGRTRALPEHQIMARLDGMTQAQDAFSHVRAVRIGHRLHHRPMCTQYGTLAA